MKFCQETFQVKRIPTGRMGLRKRPGTDQKPEQGLLRGLTLLLQIQWTLTLMGVYPGETCWKRERFPLETPVKISTSPDRVGTNR